MPDEKNGAQHKIDPFDYDAKKEYMDTDLAKAMLAEYERFVGFFNRTIEGFFIFGIQSISTDYYLKHEGAEDIRIPMKDPRNYAKLFWDYYKCIKMVCQNKKKDGTFGKRCKEYVLTKPSDALIENYFPILIHEAMRRYGFLGNEKKFLYEKRWLQTATDLIPGGVLGEHLYDYSEKRFGIILEKIKEMAPNQYLAFANKVSLAISHLERLSTEDERKKSDEAITILSKEWRRITHF